MEKIVKAYSNNSKKARLKRNKNKFQRVWDAEKQTYIKVRKAKYPVNTNAKKKDWREVDNSSALKRRSKTSKKSVPVKATVTVKKETLHKPETKQPARKQVPKVCRIHGRNLVWDSSILRYKLAA